MNINDMVMFWTNEINTCLDECAPWKTRKFRKKKKYVLPKEIRELIQIRNNLHKELRKNTKKV